MKRIILSIIIVISVVSDSWSKDGFSHSVKVDDITIERQDDELIVNFSFHADKKAVGRNYNMFIHPVLTNGTDSLALPAITIYGKGYNIIEKRHALVAGQAPVNTPYVLRNGQTIFYNVNVEYQDWMEGALINLSGIKIGCCSAVDVSIGTIAQNISTNELEFEVIEKEIPEQVIPISTGDMLSKQFPFLELKSDKTPDFSELEMRKGALTIYFRQSEHVIDRNYKENSESLMKLIAAVRAINASSDTRIEQIVIAGFASPEGTLAFNQNLAGNRADALKYFIISYTNVTSPQIYLYNGGVDWDGLYHLVEQSGMVEKMQIMNIIKNTPIWDSRLQTGRNVELKLLNSGVPYRYMFKHFFPLLRNAAYVKVYYSNMNATSLPK